MAENIIYITHGGYVKIHDPSLREPVKDIIAQLFFDGIFVKDNSITYQASLLYDFGGGTTAYHVSLSSTLVEGAPGANATTWKLKFPSEGGLRPSPAFTSLLLDKDCEVYPMIEPGNQHPVFNH